MVIMWNRNNTRRRPQKRFIRNICVILIVVAAIGGGTLLLCKNHSKDENKQDKITKAKSSENDSTNMQPALKKEPKKVKALYLTGWVIGNPKNLDHYIHLASETEINSYVVDIKDVDGHVGYKSDVSDVINCNTWEQRYDVDQVIKALHENNIYVIGRIVCFKDPIYSSKHPDYAIKNSKGGVWRDNHNLTWLNPYSKESWKYIVDIAKEATQKGFDEIQLDYVRFANDGPKAQMNFGSVTQKKHEIINEFLAYVKSEMPNTIVSADIFGIACESPGDMEDIGQHLELIGKDIEYICPMVYPSHYAAGQFVNNVKFTKPDFEPYGVVYNSLIKAKERISAPGVTYKAAVRPYLQDFTAKWLGKGNYLTYGAPQVRQQIKAVYDAGFNEWIFWSGSNSYSESAFEKSTAVD